MALCSYNGADFNFNEGAKMEILDEHQDGWDVKILNTEKVGRIPRRSRPEEETVPAPVLAPAPAAEEKEPRRKLRSRPCRDQKGKKNSLHYSIFNLSVITE